MRSGETSSTRRATSLLPRPLAQLVGLAAGVLGAADVEERLLGQVVQLAVDQRLERLHRLLDRREDAGQAGEGLGHEHGLRKEPLDLAGPGDRDLVLLDSSSRPRMAMMSCSSL